MEQFCVGLSIFSPNIVVRCSTGRIGMSWPGDSSLGAGYHNGTSVSQVGPVVLCSFDRTQARGIRSHDIPSTSGSGMQTPGAQSHAQAEGFSFPLRFPDRGGEGGKGLWFPGRQVGSIPMVSRCHPSWTGLAYLARLPRYLRFANLLQSLQVLGATG